MMGDDARIGHAMRIARDAVVSDIETEGLRMPELGARVYDARPLLDERELSTETIDRNRLALTWGLAAGVLWRVDALTPWLLQIVISPPPPERTT